MKRVHIFCNWKMNPQSRVEATVLVQKICEWPSVVLKNTVLFSPAIFLESVVRAANKKVACGTQDVSAHANGSYTGQISARMAKNAGAAYTIAGHSERRLYEHDTDKIVAQKIARAFEQKLIPVACVGETKHVSIQQSWRAVKKQLDAIIPVLQKFSNKKLFIAYEPVWAIGGHKKIAPKQAAEMIMRIKLYMRAQTGAVPPVLYGGSVNGKSVRDLLPYIHIIDGFLIGSASVNYKELLVIQKILYGR